MKRIVLLLGMLTLCGGAAAGAAEEERFVRVRESVPGEYIVVLRADAPPPASARNIIESHGARLGGIYTEVIRGFWIKGNEEQARKLSRHPWVEFVEENAVFRVAGTQYTKNPSSDGDNSASDWYLDRLDQSSSTDPRRNGSYSWCSPGSGSRIYVVDTGVRPDHPEFSGRFDTQTSQAWIDWANHADRGHLIWYHVYEPCWEHLWGNNLNSPPDPNEPTEWTAAAGHGTAVASIAAGTTYGVAKQATIVDVRAFECVEGKSDSKVLIAAFDWIRIHAPKDKAVVNLSASSAYWTIPDYSAVMQAMESLAQVVPVVTAAGNANDNVYWYFPGRSAYDITIAGLNKHVDINGRDVRWSQSNFGAVDLYAPAQFIESASHYFNGYRWVTRSELADCSHPIYTDRCVSGTSFAAPQAAGAAARYLQSYPSATPTQVRTFLQSRAFATVTQPDGSTIPVLNMSRTACP
jgi:subtilisin family serine protease